MQKKYLTSEIFTPASPATHTYLERDSLNEKLVDALMTPGKQIIIYGFSGSGKSTLLINKLNQTYEGCIISRCIKGMKFDQLIIDAFDQLGKFYTSEISKSKSLSVSSEIGASYNDIKAILGVEYSSQSSIKDSLLLPPQLTPKRLASYIGASNYCWVIEDFHKIEADEKIKISQLMKVFMDESASYKNLKIIAIGAVGTAREVVEYDRELENRVVEIHVPLMSKEEIEKIILTGEKFLNIGLDVGVRESIAKFSIGYASVAHQLCLNLCFINKIYETSDNYISIDVNDFQKALEKFVEEYSEILKKQFDVAMQPFEDNDELSKEILTSILKLDKSCTLKEILTYINQKGKHILTETELNKYLVELCSDGRNQILRYDNISKRYSFSNPFLKIYSYCNIEILNNKPQLEIDFHKFQDGKREMIRLIIERSIKSNVDF